MPQGICVGNGILIRGTIAKEIIAKIDKWDCIKLKTSQQRKHQSEETAYRIGENILLAIHLDFYTEYIKNPKY
jgi:hypothetical protein